MSALRIEGVSVELDRNPILDRVSLEVADGAWTALIGPNGAGKSTLLRAVAGLVPYRGRVHLDGAEIAELRRREVARRLAFVPQAPLLPPGMRVRDYVLLGRTPHLGTFSHEGRHDLEAAREAMARLDLEAFANRPLATLSGGEQQRAVLARALAQEAPFLLLDEPTAALDLGRQQQVLELVAGLREQGRLTVLCAMHDLTLAGQYAERLVLLSRGRVVAEGAAGEIATEEMIATHYGARVRIARDEDGGVAVIPVRD